MVENSFKHNQQKSIFSKITALLFCLFLFSACTDQGCIDADDFGEYESQTITVTSNADAGSCDYDITQDLNDTTYQSTDLISCFTSGTATIYDANGDSQTGNSGEGCDGFSEETYKTICVNGCVQKCLADSQSSSTGAEPRWITNDERSSTTNVGVSIMPGSEISITASGTIDFGSDLEYDDIFVQSNYYAPHTRDSDWDDIFFDVRAGQSLNIKFSGKWDDGSTTVGSGSNALSSTKNSTDDAKIYNAARRLAFQIIPHPDGYNFDTSATSEESGSKVVPLLPDPVSWQCSYSGSTNQLQSDCGNNTDTGYTSNGYSYVSNELAAERFYVTSEEYGGGLGTYGGFIRWLNDGLVYDSYDPFSSLSCSDKSSLDSCDLAGVVSTNLSTTSGTIIGDFSTSDVAINNPSTAYSYKLYFKSLVTNGDCDMDLSIQVTDSSNAIIMPRDTTSSSYTTISVDDDDWTTDNISLEPGHILTIASDSADGTCGEGIAVKFAQYHDITINKSGFIKFLTFGDSLSTENCTLYGRIINPTGSHTDSSFTSTGSISGYSADFYEYGDFDNSSSIDPLDGLTVYPYSGTGTMQWSNRAFVRQGQKIRFDPESWDTNFTTAAGTRKCGIGMAMYIDPRPALLCRGVSSSETILNSGDCLPDYDSNGDLIGCQAYSAECIDDTSSSYCPSTDCQFTVTCTTNGTESNNYTKSGCSKATSQGDSCTYVREDPDDTSSDYLYDDTSCTACSNLKLTAAQLPAKLTVPNLIQCYDLENYKGKVANIPFSTGFSEDELADSEKAKGAIKLQGFSTNYGNIYSIIDTEEQDSYNSNQIFQKSEAITFAESGRLRFFMIDGDDFNGPSGTITAKASSGDSTTSSLSTDGGAIDAYNDNSDELSSYSGTNGLKINMSGTLIFSNGAWLEARLCENSNDSPCITSNSAGPTQISNQPGLISITAPTSSSELSSPDTGSSPYNFDSNGSLFRVTSASTGDCQLTNVGVETQPGSYFYCHSKYYNDENPTKLSDNIKKLRLSFKILDPEIATCNTSDPSSTSGYNGILLENSYYDSSVSSNIGATCNAGVTLGSGSGECQKQYYCANKYINNSGEYYVKIKVKKRVADGISSMIGSVVTPIIEIMDGPKHNCSTTTGYVTEAADMNGVRTLNSGYNSSTGSASDIDMCNKTDYDNDNCDDKYYCEEARVGQAERVYKLLITDTRYKTIVNVAFTMMFTFYGLGFLMGISELNHSEIINRLLKIGLIYVFIGENGWYWFDTLVVNFFKNGTDYLAFLMASSFDDSPTIAQAISKQDYYDKAILFNSVDKVFNMFFSLAVQKKISALLFASIFGWAYLLIILYGFFLYVYAVANAVLLYLTAQVFISILFVLGPIFFIFTLFSQTREMFDNWLKQLIGFSLQQIFLLTTLAFFNMLMYEVIKMALGYKICWDEVWTINIIFRVSLMSFWTIASIPPRTSAQTDVGNITNVDGIPSLFTILFIWVIASLMDKFIQFMTDLAATISGGLSASSLGSGIKAAATDLKNKASGLATNVMWEQSGLQERAQSIDKTLFDSGKLAKVARDERRKANRENSRLISKMRKAGDEAVSDLKKNNINGYNNKTEEQQAQMRRDAMKKAQEEMGAKLGLSPEKIKELRSQKGVKSESTNLSGYLADQLTQRARHRWDGGRSSVHKSMDEEDGKSSYSKKEANKAMENMTAEERKNFAESGAEVDKSMGDKAYKMAGKGVKSIGSAITGTVSGTASAITGTASAVYQLRNPNQARKDAAKAMKSAASNLGSSMSSAAGSAWDYLTDKDGKEAKEELRNEGAVDRMQPGFDWAMPQEQKDAIKERKKQNRKERKAKKQKNVSKSSLRYLDRQAKYLDTKKNSKYGTAGAMFENAGEYLAGNSKKDLAQNIEQKSQDNIAKSVNKELEQVAYNRKNIDQGLIELEGKRKDYLQESGLQDKMDKVSDSKKRLEELEKERSLGAKIVNEFSGGTLSVSKEEEKRKKEIAFEKGNAIKLQEEIDQDAKLTEFDDQIKMQKVAMHQAKTHEENILEKQSNLPSSNNNKK